jgi:GNAT superfamily N-acetyltransferase
MIEIRDAAAGDHAAWLPLWDGYCAFYKATIPAEVTAATWARILDPMNPLTARLAFADGRLVGFAHHHTHLTTWDRRPTAYLEDLFVAPDIRGTGAGRALIDDLLALARARDWASVYWITAEDNATARKLYDRFGGRDAFVRYSIGM